MKRCNYSWILIFFIGSFLSAKQPPPNDIDDLSNATHAVEIPFEDEIDEVIENFDEIEYVPRATVFEQRNFEADFHQNYQGKAFNYEEKTTETKHFSLLNFNLPVGLLKVLMYLFLGIIILLILFQLFKNLKVNPFHGKNKTISPKSLDEQALDNPENIQSLNFEQMIAKAKSELAYRRAVRLYHLWTLQKLTQKKLIIWNKNKTDHEYFLELNSHPLQPLFYQSTYIYDNIWYGNFELNATQFEHAESIFQHTLAQIK